MDRDGASGARAGGSWGALGFISSCEQQPSEIQAFWGSRTYEGTGMEAVGPKGLPVENQGDWMGLGVGLRAGGWRERPGGRSGTE